ncbi:MAG: amidohydrolase [bacterium]|nr:amidohydrolase [bacterium]
MTTTIYRARRIISMTDHEPEAFAVLNGRIVATGAATELAARFPGSERVDFGDGVVIPGLNDAHCHLGITAEDLLHLDLSVDAVHSLAQIIERLRGEAARTPSGTWLRGSRYDDAKMAEGRVLTRWDLDGVSREHPIMVLHVAGHWGVLNSSALELGGIDDASQPPEGGAFGRDASGRLNGILYEQAIFNYAYPATAKNGKTIAPPSAFEERLLGLARGVKMFHAAGLTSITDALVSPQDIALFQEAERRGTMTLRVNMLLGYEHYDAVRRLGIRTGLGGERLRLGGVKSFVDGAIGGRTCMMEEPFEGTTDDFGIQSVSTSDLRDLVRMVHGDGNRVGIHANGDRAIKLLLGLLEEAQNEHPHPEIHHRIEHCTVVSDDILARMKRLGAIAVPFGSYVHYHGGKLVDWYGSKRLERMFAHRWFLDAGIAVAGSSDFPCGPFEPLLALQSCVTRRGYDSVVMGENQRITAREALALYTVNAAYAAGEEHLKGRLAPGFLADFVVLGGDPLTVAPERIGALPVRETYVGGARVWREGDELPASRVHAHSSVPNHK